MKVTLVDCSVRTRTQTDMYIRCATPRMAAEWLTHIIQTFGIHGEVNWTPLTVELGPDGMAR